FALAPVLFAGCLLCGRWCGFSCGSVIHVILLVLGCPCIRIVDAIAGALFLSLPYLPSYFPSGGFGFRRYLSRYDSLRVFTLWHGGHNHCRLLSSSVPPRAWLMMWSSSKGSPSPQCAHSYGSWCLACCLIFFHALVDVRLLPF